MRFILILMVCLFSSEVFGQERFIETKYSRSISLFGTNRLTYSANNVRLDDAGLGRLFTDNPTSQNFLHTARRDKGIGLPLVIIGSAGLISSLFFLDSRNTEFQSSDLIFHGSLLVGSLGSGFLTTYERNRLLAVNNYNNDLYDEMALADTEPLIELQYAQNIFRFMAYYQEGYRLNNRALTSLLGDGQPYQDLMRKANTQRGIGTGLTIAGALGLIGGTALLFDDERSGLILAGSSFVSLISGGILLNASRANRQSAVNLYNKQLFESATGTASINFNVNHTGGGLVLSF